MSRSLTLFWCSSIVSTDAIFRSTGTGAVPTMPENSDAFGAAVRRARSRISRSARSRSSGRLWYSTGSSGSGDGALTMRESPSSITGASIAAARLKRR